LCGKYVREICNQINWEEKSPLNVECDKNDNNFDICTRERLDINIINLNHEKLRKEGFSYLLEFSLLLRAGHPLCLILRIIHTAGVKS
jgi:hypothetical protein